MPPLPSCYQGRQKHNLFSLRPGQQRIDHILNGLGANRLTAFRTMGLTGTGKEQPQVVINFRYRANGGAGILTGCFLLNGNSRLLSHKQIDMGFINLSNKVAGLVIKRLYVTALSFGIQGVKGKG